MRLACLAALCGCSSILGFEEPKPLAPIDAAAADAPDAPPGCSVDEVAAASARTCARLADRTIRCWGIDDVGQLGVPATAMCNASSPMPCTPSPTMVSVSGILSLGLGDTHSCALSQGNVYCWGSNTTGAFGNGSTTSSSTPLPITLLAGSRRLVGGSGFSCTVKQNQIYCNGTNTHGEIGNSSVGGAVLAPSQVTTTGNVDAIAAGFSHACAVLDGNVYCWGSNNSHQIDQTATLNVSTPRAVGIANAVDLALGSDFSCARLLDFTAKCWGANNNGQLGDGSTMPRTLPVAVSIPFALTQISASGVHACALDNIGDVRCWGETYGPVPTKISLSRKAIAISSGSYHECAILDDHTLWCWGWNMYGQLGAGPPAATINLTPVKVPICP